MPLGDPLEVPEGVVYGVAFAPDGATLAVGCLRNLGEALESGVMLYDARSLSPLLGGPMTLAPAEIGRLAFSPDSLALAASFTELGAVVLDLDPATWG